MHKFCSLIGKKFGKLTVQSLSKREPRYIRYKCQCDCGNITIVRSDNLLSSNTRSCGCQKTKKKHGLYKHPIYAVWAQMKARCLNKKHPYYYLYGGRGISICEKWMRIEGFVSDMGFPQPKYTLDRIDPNGNYELSNCRWTTRFEQSNNLRGNLRVSYQGKTKTISQWAKELHINRFTLRNRIVRGWSVDRAFEQSVQSRPSLSVHVKN